MIKLSWVAALCAATAVLGCAQDPVGMIEGEVRDASGAAVSGSAVSVLNRATGFRRATVSNAEGLFRVPLLPVGDYAIEVTSDRFARWEQPGIRVNVGLTVRLTIALEVAARKDAVTVTAEAPLVDAATNILGKVVTGHEITELPLNGRNFTQLGLLQTGVAPLTAGVKTAGGSLRQGQAYTVNGMRPESNVYLVDGANNGNRMDGGYALKVPVDAIAEFRILTQSAPPEYGGTGGATTSVVSRAGTNNLHGTLYEFLRNDRLDARNFFSEQVEPLKQNQFGATLGGPIKKEKLFLFGYFEGFRNRQGTTWSAAVPTPEQRQGDFSGRTTPLLNLAAGGTQFPSNRIPTAAIDPVALNVINLYPLGNVTPSLYRATLVATDDYNQAGLRADYNLSSNDQFFARYSYSGGHALNPISVRGSEVPGFPTRDDTAAHSAVVSETHLFTPALSNQFRAAFLRYEFLFDQRLNQTPPSALGFAYNSASQAGQGPPFFNISGYSPVGGAITGPRLSAQNNYEVSDSAAWFRGNHAMKFGASFLRTQVNMFQAIAPNAFYVFASTFPTNDAIANLLLGAPVTFYQGLGDFNRGLRNWTAGLYAQDEWRVNRRLTINYGIRYERVNPLRELRSRLNGFIPGVQSQMRPDAPKGLLFPGDPGIGPGIAHDTNGWMPRIGMAWDPTGAGRWSVRASYGIFYEPFQNGSGTASQGPVSALPWAQFNQYSGAGLNFSNPYLNQIYPVPGTFVRPSTVFAIDASARPPYAQNWNFGVQRSFRGQYVVEVRYVGSKGTHLPRNVEANPAVFGPGANAQNADRRRIYANCPASGAACDFSTVAMLSNITNSTYHAAQASISRRFTSGVALNVSYWFSKTLDYLSAMNLSGAAAKPLSGENDLAQNPFNLAAEHGPSLFDARHRLVASGSYEVRMPKSLPSPVHAVGDHWQLNAILSHNSPTPFTVADSTNVSLQANSPPISGFAASRPNLIGDPNAGPRTVDNWINRAAFQRLDPVTQAGQFGNAGRNIARAPAFTNLDLSLTRSFALSERTRLQFRAETFNIANHPNFVQPVADLNSPNFGRILTAASPRLLQFGLKLVF
ncbi:MAG: TonB-dependent receptor [Candidatus Solibacter sp.]